jgi:FtsP/CotA-like multicopper oxidase with cupredoxin domain
MRTRKLTLEIGAAALTLATLPLAVNQALAAEYWLKAVATTVQMPDPSGTGTVGVPMWGYASCTDNTFASCGPVSVPGPALSVLAGDPVLTVNLRNALTGPLAGPTSLVINGLIKPMAPEWTIDAQGRRRVRSFDSEAAVGSTTSYTWPDVKPGTYLYQSGTQPQVQVQMGLYGAVTKNYADATITPAVAPAQAYAGAPYDSQATLLYSEIDPALHTAVDTGTYGTATTSTLDYAPKYFLINGQPFPVGTPVISPAGATLLRFLNAGLTTHVPMIQGAHWTLIAEDGKAYPYRRDQYTALLPAAKTMDVLLTPDIGGASYAIMDRRLSLSNAGVSDGGMLAFLRYGGQGTVGGGSSDPIPNQPPVALDDSYTSVPGVALSIGATEGVLSQQHLVDSVMKPDHDPDSGPLPIKAVAASGATSGGGTYTLNSNGSFAYTPLVGFAGASDTFKYQATDGKALSGEATVTISLIAPVAPSLSVLDPFDPPVIPAPGLGPYWKQASDAAGPNLKIAGNMATAAAVNLGGQAIWARNTAPIGSPDTSLFGPKQYAAFTSTGSLTNSALILKATGGTLEAPTNFVRVRYEAPVSGGEIVVATMMGGNNSGVYIKQAAFPTGTSSGPLIAAVDEKGMVSVFQGITFVGAVQLPDVGVWKGGGRVGIQLQTLGASIDDFSGGTL